MTLMEIARQIRACGAMARRELYMRGNEKRANEWAAAADSWLGTLDVMLKLGRDRT